MAYTLKVHRDVEKQLQRIPKKQRERLVTTMRSLRTDPRPVGSVKLDDQLYRIRQGQYRVIYAVFDKEVVVVICKVARRSGDTYRNLQTLLDRAESILGQR
jgi:mRNA interferase RelE/StbE